ncbi:hypothetical protein EB061_11870, partial [bacterium]|nr:hypothetical protein [bacterium]
EVGGAVGNADERIQTYRLVGQRKKVTPSNSLNAIASMVNGKLSVEITDSLPDPEYNSRLGKTVVTAVVYRVRSLWADKKINTIVKELDEKNPRLVIDTGFAADKKERAYVTYYVQRIGSPFFNESESVHKDSNQVKF